MTKLSYLQQIYSDQHLQSEFTYVQGLWTHANVIGKGAPLVVIPGVACASWMYTRLAQALAPSHTVYIYDPPGHGWSQGHRHYPISIQQLTDHFAEWLIKNQLPRAALLGHSLGGEVVFDLAARYPHLVSKIIACAPTGIPENPNVLIQSLRFLRNLPQERFNLLLKGFKAYSIFGSARLYKLLKDQHQHATGPLLAHIHAPTLLIKGSLDVVIQAWTIEAIRAAMPNARIREIQSAPHALTDSHPQTIARYTRDFLA